MNSLMSYKGYRAKIEFDPEDEIFVGHVLGINDSLNFHGASVKELIQAFHDCIENYLEYCKQCGKAPEKEYKGVFNVRIQPETHRKAAFAAAAEGVTMNQFVAEAIDAYLDKKAK